MISYKTQDPRIIEEKEKNELLKSTLNLNNFYFQHKNNDTSNFIIHRAFTNQLKNERQGNANTKTRAEVRGGGKKPWRQKGSGNARAGSKRSPIWTGGGVSFGPRTKNYNSKLNKKEARLALRLALSKKLHNIVLVEDFFLSTYKTKNFLNIIKNILPNFNNSEKIVIILPPSNYNDNIKFATKNLKNIILLQPNQLDIKTIVLTKSLIIMTPSLKIIEETYND
jgi:large subunit ribosomal protein L4